MIGKKRIEKDAKELASLVKNYTQSMAENEAQKGEEASEEEPDNDERVLLEIPKTDRVDLQLARIAKRAAEKLLAVTCRRLEVQETRLMSAAWEKHADLDSDDLLQVSGDKVLLDDAAMTTRGLQQIAHQVVLADKAALARLRQQDIQNQSEVESGGMSDWVSDMAAALLHEQQGPAERILLDLCLASQAGASEVLKLGAGSHPIRFLAHACQKYGILTTRPAAGRARSCNSPEEETDEGSSDPDPARKGVVTNLKTPTSASREKSMMELRGLIQVCLESYGAASSMCVDANLHRFPALRQLAHALTRTSGANTRSFLGGTVRTLIEEWLADAGKAQQFLEYPPTKLSHRLRFLIEIATILAHPRPKHLNTQPSRSGRSK